MSRDEEEIRQLVKDWAEATQRGDTAAVLKLMADDVVFLTASQPPMDKATFESAMKAQSPTQAAPKLELSSEIQEIQIFGEWAFMWTKLNMLITPAAGSAITRAGPTLSILKKQNGGWVIARDANMLSVVRRRKSDGFVDTARIAPSPTPGGAGVPGRKLNKSRAKLALS